LENQAEHWATMERHAKVRFLAEPHPYKVLYGGRNGLKSWSMARQLIVNTLQRPIRWLCCRETMHSIEDSVHQLLSDQIHNLQASAHFRILKNRIEGINGSLITYAGLRTDASHIKSYENYDGAWVEEAAQVSKASWEILLPTIRKAGSEIWVSFNPELETDDTYKRWVLAPPPGAVVKRTSWMDAEEVGWLSAESKAKIEHLRVTDPDSFAHVYDGLCIQIVEGAIYAAELRQTEKDERIRRVPYDATKPVYTFWDLGFGDETSIWFVQAFPFEYRLIDYEEGSGFELKHYQKRLQERPYVYATHYLPHDATAKQLGTGRSIEELMRSAGFTVRIVPKLSLRDGINAARTIFPQCWFDGEKCADGLQALRHYRWAPESNLGVPKREPLHDWASNGADAFRYFSVGIRKPPAPKPIYLRDRTTPERHVGAWS
jgi:phage terminase large subunit